MNDPYDYLDSDYEEYLRRKELMENETLAIWFKNGNTAFFEQVENMDIANGYLIFEYFGVSSQTKRGAIFKIDNLAGFATSDIENTNLR